MTASSVSAHSAQSPIPVPVAPGRLPLLGHAVPLFRDPLGFVRSLADVGPVVRVDLGPQAMYVVTDPGLTRRVLREGKTFDKGGALFDKVRELTGDSLLTSHYALHHRQRRLMQPAFTGWTITPVDDGEVRPLARRATLTPAPVWVRMRPRSDAR